MTPGIEKLNAELDYLIRTKASANAFRRVGRAAGKIHSKVVAEEMKAMTDAEASRYIDCMPPALEAFAADLRKDGATELAIAAFSKGWIEGVGPAIERRIAQLKAAALRVVN